MATMEATRWSYAHVREYLALCRWAFSETHAGRQITLSWAGRSLGPAEWRRSFLRALDRRINMKAGPEPDWRKLGEIYQRELERDCRAIRDRVNRRVALHKIATPELRRRFGHLISDQED